MIYFLRDDNLAEREQIKKASEALLRYGLWKEHGIEEEPEFYKTQFGKPYLVGYDDIFFNLSNSVGAVAVALDSGELGIDIEKSKDDFDERITKRICSDEEKASIKSPSDFYRIWTAKESYIKAIGTGFACGFDQIKEDAVGLRSQMGEFYIRSIKAQGYWITVSAKRPIDLEKELVILQIDQLQGLL